MAWAAKETTSPDGGGGAAPGRAVCPNPEGEDPPNKFRGGGLEDPGNGGLLKENVPWSIWRQKQKKTLPNKPTAGKTNLKKAINHRRGRVINRCGAWAQKLEWKNQESGINAPLASSNEKRGGNVKKIFRNFRNPPPIDSQPGVARGCVVGRITLFRMHLVCARVQLPTRFATKDIQGWLEGG